jgi:hypothetical protein
MVDKNNFILLSEIIFRSMNLFKIDGVNYKIRQAFLDAQLDEEEENVLFIGLEINTEKVDEKTKP